MSVLGSCYTREKVTESSLPVTLLTGIIAGSKTMEFIWTILIMIIMYIIWSKTGKCVTTTTTIWVGWNIPVKLVNRSVLGVVIMILVVVVMMRITWTVWNIGGWMGV